MPDAEDASAKSGRTAARSLRLHSFYKGKVQVMPKCAVSGLADFALWYTPGVAAPCTAITADPDLVYEHTNKGNSVAVVSDGTRVLGLGNIGPEAGLPVMEGKALLFKYLGGVDAVAICVKTDNAEALIQVTRALEPSFGGINLEDISQPKCFRVLDALREDMNIPVWHDDQQGSATALLAGLLNALSVVGKDLSRVKLALIGTGAANVATYRLLAACGVDKGAIVACDSKGTLHKGRRDIEHARGDFPDKWRICQETNAEGIVGGIGAAMRGADACIAMSRPGPGVIGPGDVAGMANDAIVFACANPTPEIWPEAARAAGARIVATGRSDFPNQINNSLVFPGLFRGVLDVRARRITDEMAMAAARALASHASERGIDDMKILPRMDEWEVAARVAAAVGAKAQEQGVARIKKSAEALYAEALARIAAARDATAVLMREGLIAEPPED
jgi:malate dehydrogenase (oxaloacetate-decarboxylating)